MGTPLNQSPESGKRGPVAPQKPKSQPQLPQKSPTPVDQGRLMSRRSLLGILLSIAVVATGASIIGRDSPQDSGVSKPDKPHGKKEEKETNDRTEELKKVAKEMKNFFRAVAQRTTPKDNDLYDEYVVQLKKIDKEDEKELQMDAFREAVMKYLASELSLTPEEREMMTHNKHFMSRTLGLINMTCAGKNIAGGKLQMDGKAIIAKHYKHFREDTDMGKAITSSEKLAKLIDPDLLFALIGNETDFVNFYNRAEGVHGAFQFTSMMPPSGNTFDLPKDLDKQLKRGKDSSDSGQFGHYVTLLRKKHYNEIYEELDDIRSNDMRKQIAMCLGFIFGNMEAISDQFADNPKVKDDYKWLMAVAFYNADIARINENLGKGKELNRKLDAGSVSAFIETLPFYKGSGAGKLYVPRFIARFALLKAIDEKGDVGEVTEEDLLQEMIRGSMKSNFGLPFKDRREG